MNITFQKWLVVIFIFLLACELPGSISQGGPAPGASPTAFSQASPLATVTVIQQTPITIRPTNTLTQPAAITLTPAPPSPSPTSARTVRINTAFILDASGSMLVNLSGRSKLTVAQDAIATLGAKLPAGVNASLWVYGHRVWNDDKTRSCRDIEQVIKLGPVNPAQFSTVARSFSAKGYTPITEALRQAAASLPVGENERNQVVLISDGEETCGGDVCALAAQLAASDVKLVIHTIGFGVDSATRAQLECIARVTGGTYRDAANADSLQSALAEASVSVAVKGVKEMRRPSSIAISPDGNHVYVTASDSEALFARNRISRLYGLA